MKSSFPIVAVLFLFLLCVYMQGNEEANYWQSKDFVKSNAFMNSIALTQSLNLARLEHIQETCRRFPPNITLNNLPPNALDHIYYNEKYKFLYCYIPKVACTNWKRILLMLSGKWNGTDLLSLPSSQAHKNTLPTLATVPEKLKNIMLKDYHKLIFVRNPFERLLSAYRNKFTVMNDYFPERHGKKIIQMFRKNPNKESLEQGRDVTFEEFVRYVTSQVEGSANEHWLPMSSLCFPCLIKYTLIGKYETLMEDATLALHTIGASHIQFPSDRTSGTAELLTEYYSKLPLKLVKQLYKYYKFDYRNFNYNLDNIIGFDLG